MSIRAFLFGSPLVLSLACGDGGGSAGSGGGTSATSGGSPTVAATGTAATGATSAAATSSSTSGGGGGGSGGGDVCAHARPGPTNTGVPSGVTLTPSGPITVDTDGAVVEGLDIDGEIQVLANNVTIRNVHIRSGDYYPIRYFDNDNTGLIVEDSEIEGVPGNDVTSAISFANYTARRLNIHGTADGFKADSNVLIEDCWIHDLSNGPGEHNDGVQSTGGPDVTLRHNDISGASNATVQTGDEGGVPTENLLIECNWLDDGGWALNIRGEGATVPVNTQIIDNRFGRNSGYGPWALDDPNPTVTGNVYDDNDEPIPYP